MKKLLTITKVLPYNKKSITRKEGHNMIKKILSGVLAVALVIMSCVTLTGCSRRKDNYSLTGIASNGGMAVVKDGYMYYIAGGTSELKDPDWRMVEAASIYKRKLDENNNPVDGLEPELVYKGIAGFTNGELFMFGDFLYFATPSEKRSNTAEKMTDRTSFCRIRLDGKKYEVLYTTETKDALKYAYYTPSDSELYLVILEGTKLYSLNVKKDKIINIAEDVTEAAFSSDFGRGNAADPYLFYTKAPSEGYLSQDGTIVFQATPDGKTNKQIASGANYGLYEIKYGYLYYSVDNAIYRSTMSAGLDRTNVVAYKTFETPFFTADGGVVASGKDEGEKQLVYILWKTTAQVEGKVLHTAEGNTPLFQVGDTLYVKTSSNSILRLTLDSGATEDEEKVKIKEVAVVEVGEGLRPEIIGNYLYYYAETKTTDDFGNEIKTWNIKAIKV